jgi:hypothetical protein
MSMAKIMGCGSATNTRRTDDAYPTPAGCTRALAKVEAGNWTPTIWEPCAGDGGLSAVLRDAGFDVVETDINDPLEFFRADFLKATSPFAPTIVTNPPYKLATEFILQAHKLGVAYHAWLLKADFLNAQRAIRLVNAIGYPARIWALTERPGFLGQGAPTMNCSWYVWSGRSERASTELLSTK